LEIDDFDREYHVGVVLVDGFINSAVEAFSQEVKFENVRFKFVGEDIINLNQLDVLRLNIFHWICFCA
jgi:hypothetical protein